MFVSDSPSHLCELWDRESANESQVWVTLNGVSKRVRITFRECEKLKEEDNLWSDVISYFWVDCP